MINTEDDLKYVLSSVDRNYLMGLRGDDTLFSGVFSWEMMDFIYINHSNIKYEDLVMKKHCLTDLFDTTQPILNIFNRYKDISTISTKRGQTISPQENTLLVHVLLKTSGS